MYRCAYRAAVSQVLANIEAAQRQNRLYDALKQGTVALKALQKVSLSAQDVVHVKAQYGLLTLCP